MADPTNDEETRPLRPTALRTLRLGELRPAGWLAGQLRLQADGMAGQLDEVWPDVGQSGWIGGEADSWERGPYWLDGLVPLAYLLEDEVLRGKVEHWVDFILDRQREDGWLGPDGSDVWPRMVVLKALLQHWSATGDGRVVPAALALADYLQTLLADWPLRDWGRFRWAELVRCLHEAYDAAGEDRLLRLAETVRAQGYDWQAYARDLPFGEKRSRDQLVGYERMAGGPLPHDEFLASHGVNVAMGLKALPVWWRHQPGDELRTLFDSLLAQLDTHHGQATGLFSADEHLAGTHPAQGTETCAVVELLLSLAVAIETWGPVEEIVERWERVAYNALPAAATADDRAHQYDQQANQVVSHVTEDRPYTNNGPDANIFGFAPHFGCCTANRHQGWPKFAARQWMATPDEGLLALSYAPCDIETMVRGVPVRISVRGDYPFADEVVITVAVDQPIAFPLQLRVPGWARAAELIDGADAATALTAGTVHTVARTWDGAETLRLRLPAKLVVDRRYAGSATVRRGPLVFALAVAESWQRRGDDKGFPDWEVHPASPWNYALELDPASPERFLEVEYSATDDAPPYSPDGARIVLRGRGRRLPEWGLAHGAADAPPASPASTDEPSEAVTLLPYGSARLRVTEVPWTLPAP